MITHRLLILDPQEYPVLVYQVNQAAQAIQAAQVNQAIQAAQVNQAAQAIQETQVKRKTLSQLI